MFILSTIWKVLKRLFDLIGVKVDSVAIVRFLAGIYFANKKVWVFGSWFGEKYSDNPRCLYENILTNHTAITAVWVTSNKRVMRYLKKKGRRCYFSGSFLSLMALAKSEALFYSQSAELDFHVERKWFLPNVLRIQLWHGMPIKHIGRQQNDRAQGAVYSDDLVAATSPCTQQTLMQAFEHNADTVQVTGLPRNDELFDSHNEKFLRSQFDIFEGTKVLVYMPTFRDQDFNLGQHTATILEQITENKELQQILKKHNAVLLIKAHFCGELAVSKRNKSHGLVRIVSLDEAMDVSDLLKISDILVTDYSSCYIDYLLLNRPVIFYQYDLKSYDEKERGFYYSLDEICAGHRVFDLSGLANAINSELSGCDQFAAHRERIRQWMHTYQDGEACSRIYSFVVNKLENSLKYFEKAKKGAR